MSINSFRCRVCDTPLRLDDNWPVHRAKNRHYICDGCNKSISTPKIPKGEGYVYLITNDSHPGRYKIGKSRNPEVRVRYFNTSCPDRAFRVVQQWYVKDSHAFEMEVHHTLEEYRLPGTEWFEGDGENFAAIIGHLHERRTAIYADQID